MIMKKITMDTTIDKTKVFKILLIILITFFSYTEARCATYYIDFLSGLNTNNGTDTSTPFKHCPGDINSTDTASSTTLAAGDRVIFKGGVQYNTNGTNKNYGIRLTWSGSGDADANRIIYDGDSGTYAARWASGADKAIIDGGGETAMGLFTFLSAGKQYITINNFVLRNGRDVARSSDYFIGLVVSYARSSYITVSNSTLSDAGHDTYDADRSGFGILGGGDYWKIYNNTITDCYLNGVNIKGNYNKVYNNTFTGKLRWTLTYANIGSVDMTGTEIYNNIFHNCGKGDYGSASFHQDWIYVFSTETGGINNLKIYNNKFYNDYSPADEFGSGFIYLGPQSSGGGGGSWNGIYIYNNVMFNGATAAPIFMTFTMKDGGDVNDIHIYNNTCYSASTAVGGSVNFGWKAGWNKYTNVYIKNNIIIRDGPYFLLSIPGSDGMDGTIEIDYNLYYSTKTTPSVKMGSCGNGYCDWAEWQALGYDAHGIGFTTVPSFKSTTPASFDLTLKSDSPCIDKGVVLGPPYNTDINGTERIGTAWDMGAYTHLPRPPRDLKIIQ